MIKINEVFNISKEIVKGVNPRTKEEIEITRTVFSNSDRSIKFYSTIEEVERYLNITLTEDLWDIIVGFFEEMENESDDDDILKCYEILEKEDVLSYGEKAYILNTFMSFNDCWLDYNFDEMLEFIDFKCALLLTMLRGNDIDDEI